MATKRFKCNMLSVNSIEALKKALESYRDSLEYKCRLVAEKLAEKGVEIARVQIADLDAIFTGELLSSIRTDYVSSQPGGAVFAVIADNDHAAFVEFGTGVVGKDSPYPYPLPEGVTWEYATGKTIRQLADGRYGWFYPGKDGQWHFTQGMPSRPFMYNTAMELMNLVVSVVKEVFA